MQKRLAKLLIVLWLASSAAVLWSAASYPSAIKSFTTRVAGDTIQPAHINDLQDEVTAIETDLLKEWTDVSFSAGNFTGSASMTWTVASGDQATFAYHKIGRRMTVAFTINATTVGGTPNTQLQIAIPGGFTSAVAMTVPIRAIDDSTETIGLAAVTASGTAILIFRGGVSNWAAATDTTSVQGVITFETTT